MPGTLDRQAEGPLVLGANPALAARLYFGPVGHIPAQPLKVLIVNRRYVLYAEGADPPSGGVTASGSASPGSLAGARTGAAAGLEGRALTTRTTLVSRVPGGGARGRRGHWGHWSRWRCRGRWGRWSCRCCHTGAFPPLIIGDYRQALIIGDYRQALIVGPGYRAIYELALNWFWPELVLVLISASILGRVYRLGSWYGCRRGSWREFGCQGG